MPDVGFAHAAGVFGAEAAAGLDIALTEGAPLDAGDLSAVAQAYPAGFDVSASLAGVIFSFRVSAENNESAVAVAGLINADTKAHCGMSLPLFRRYSAKPVYSSIDTSKVSQSRQRLASPG